MKRIFDLLLCNKISKLPQVNNDQITQKHTQPDTTTRTRKDRRYG